MLNFDDLKVGDKLKCVNNKGWASFTKGCVYEVTEVWGKFDININLDNVPVACEYSKDFEKVKE